MIEDDVPRGIVEAVVPDDARSDGHVLLDVLELLVVKATRLKEHLLIDADLSDIVKGRVKLDSLDERLVEPSASRDELRENRDAAHVIPRLLVEELVRVLERRDHREVQ